MKFQHATSSSLVQPLTIYPTVRGAERIELVSSDDFDPLTAVSYPEPSTRAIVIGTALTIEEPLSNRVDLLAALTKPMD